MLYAESSICRNSELAFLCFFPPEFSHNDNPTNHHTKINDKTENIFNWMALVSPPRQATSLYFSFIHHWVQTPLDSSLWSNISSFSYLSTPPVYFVDFSTPFLHSSLILSSPGTTRYPSVFLPGVSSEEYVRYWKSEEWHAAQKGCASCHGFFPGTNQHWKQKCNSNKHLPDMIFIYLFFIDPTPT